MCGIIIAKEDFKISLLAHRGIEYNNIKRHGYNICHHRLPIQTEQGDEFSQPMVLNDGGLLLFNGEIFNYPEKFSCDSEYLKSIFGKKSMGEILQESNGWDGFWSIVYVSVNGMFYCFTDPLGKKQLYYNDKGEICSEIRPLMNINSKIDEYYKSHVFKFGYCLSDSTPYTNIKRVLPNRLYTFMSNRLLNISVDQYYNWGNNAYLYGKSISSLLEESVKRRLISKTYEIGCLVSGGLDSSIIAYLLNKLGAKVNFYTIENGETEYIDILEKYLGIKVKRLSYDINGSIYQSLKWNETPVDLGSVIPQHEIMKVIPEKIVLTGDGADELFGGYRRIIDYDSQMSDIFDELTFYHLPRLDRASMRYTIELRNPFLGHDVVKAALMLKYKDRMFKEPLKNEFNHLPKEILMREKLPLKNPELVEDPINYRKKVFSMFYNNII